MKTTLSVLRLLGLALAGLTVFLVVVVSAMALYLTQSLPQLTGEIIVEGASEPVRITRNKHGIPHIEARSLEDALFGLGFVHGQDRLWQMELARRLMQGRMAEIAGPPAVTADVYLRSLGLYRAAESAAKTLSDEARTQIASYAAGVNAAMKTHRGPLPPEFTLAQVTPQAWQSADSVAVVKTLAMMLSANAFREVLRMRLLQTLTAEQINQYAPPFNAEMAAVLKPLLAGTKPGDLTRWAEAFETKGASNNWVVDGARTASGKPLLANDPHLGLTVPAIWYLAKLSWPGNEAAGATIPGIPSIIAGRNQALAWGLTTTGADTQDVILERINPKNPDEYETPAGMQRFKERQETIKVRFGADRTITIRETANGPVIPAEDPRVSAIIPKGYVASLRWPALSGTDRTIETSLKVVTSSDASELSIADVFKSYVAPIQSFVYAGADGPIGKIIPGAIPIRDPAQIGRGLVPSLGGVAGTAWQGTVPYAGWPHERNGTGQSQFITANNKVVPDTHPNPVALEWDTEYRATRIMALLNGKNDLTVEDMKRMQRDTIDQYAVEILPLLLRKTQPGDGASKTAIAMLRTWNGDMKLDLGQPLIFAAWMRALSKAVYADELGDVFPLQWSYQAEFITRIVKGDEGFTQWCDDIATKDKQENCAGALSQSLSMALKELASTYGQDMAHWRWRDAHVAQMRHSALGQIPVLGSLFNISIPIPGGAHTIDRADHRMASPAPFAAVHGSGYRGIYDLGDFEASLFMIATGQSGNVYSPYYADLAPLWAMGGYVTLGQSAFRGPDMKVLTLTTRSAPRRESRAE